MTRAGAGARAGRLGTGLPSRGSTSSARLVAVSRPLTPEPFGRSPSDVQGEVPPTPPAGFLSSRDPLEEEPTSSAASCWPGPGQRR